MEAAFAKGVLTVTVPKPHEVKAKEKKIPVGKADRPSCFLCQAGESHAISPAQVFRLEEEGRAVRDAIARAEETLPGRPLLRPVMRGGRRLAEGTIEVRRAGARRKRSPACPGTSVRSSLRSGDTRRDQRASPGLSGRGCPGNQAPTETRRRAAPERPGALDQHK